jgi:hypothetical protein
MNFHTENPFFKYGKPYSNITSSQIFKYEKPYLKIGEIQKQLLVISKEEPFNTLLNLGVWKSIPFYKYQYGLEKNQTKQLKQVLKFKGYLYAKTKTR